MNRPLPLLILVAACAACGGSATPAADLAVVADMAAAPDLGPASDLAWSAQLIADRPYESKVPSKYDAAKPTPLVLALHGLGDSGANFAQGFGLLQLADAKTFLVAYPDGTLTGFGGNYWNANDVCCQLTSPVPDDVAYLNAVIGDMSEKYNVDPRRIFVVGLSNGGMMAHRLACDASGRVAAVVSISGAQFRDDTQCQPSRTVNVLEVHGDKDTTVPYQGGPTLNGLGPMVNSAHATIEVWVARNGCGPAPEAGTPVNIDAMLAGDETTIERYKDCGQGGATELWTVVDGVHVPRLTPTAPGLLYDWLSAHAR